MTCLFCSMIAGEIPAHGVYQNDHVFAFLDIGPVSKGHTLIIPKVHAENLGAGTADTARHLMDAVYVLAPAIMQAVKADGYSLGMNHGECAGQEVLHTHLHIMPRWNGVPRTFTKEHPSQEELKVTAETIRSFLG
jgi:histidine triad (HIT) family protein